MLCVGAQAVPRSGLSQGTDQAYNSVEKWVFAALRVHESTLSDLLLHDLEPNDPLASSIHSTLADWHTSQTLARTAGVRDARDAELDKPPPQEILVKARGYLLRHINGKRAEEGLVRALHSTVYHTLFADTADPPELIPLTIDNTLPPWPH